jgi:hypothetical protein
MENILFYKIGNYFFFIFHIILIFFNLFGWIPKRLRKLNLISLSLTAFSWFVLGIFYGFGYCFLTDWHWQIREKLGYSTESNSYIHFLIVELTNISLNENLVDTFTAIFFFIAFTASIYVNVRSGAHRQQKV